MDNLTNKTTSHGLTAFGANIPLTMSSREIAELTGSTHDNVLKTVRSLIDRGVVSKNETPYTHPQNGQTYSEFRLNYRDTMVVVSGYSVELRARIIDRWQELEAKGAVDLDTALNDPAFLRNTLATYAVKVLALQGKVEEMRPLTQALERIAVSDGTFCITDAAKTLQVQPKVLFSFLRSNGWIYSRAGGAEVAYQDKLAQGLLEHKTTTVTRTDGSEKSVTQVRVTTKGLTRLAQECPPIARLI